MSEEIKHEQRVVGHITGRKEYTDTCVCGKPWPCPDCTPKDSAAPQSKSVQKRIAAQKGEKP